MEARWTSVPRYSWDELKKTYSPRSNVGLRLGAPSNLGGGEYVYVIDLDIRKPELADEAYDALETFLPDFDRLPTVASGSGGESRHFYFTSTALFSSRKLAHSADSFIGEDGSKHWAWEIELFGTGKQVAIPPSVHPSGGVYRWITPFDLDGLLIGDSPSIPASVVSQWAPVRGAAAPVDDDDLVGLVRSQPTDLGPDEVRRVLEDLPPVWFEDRDSWLQVGMALHHQFAGSQQGYRIWTVWSKQSEKFNERDQQRVWDSFEGKLNSVTFKTIIKAAADAKLKDMLVVDGGGEDYDPDDDDLIGPPPADPSAPEVEWTSLLQRNEEGALKPTLHNALLIVKNDPRTKGVPMLNQFTQEVVQRVVPLVIAPKKRRGENKGTKQLAGPIWTVKDAVNGDLWSDAKDNSLRALIEAPPEQGGYGIKVTDRDLKAAVDLAARDCAFHPVREHITRLTWDGKARAERLFVDYLGAPSTAYTRSVGRLFLLAAVTRIFEPGHKFDFAVILEGLQGRRKSTFIATLAHKWFSELDGDFHDTKQMVESMQGAWILEIPELSGFGRSDVRQIKAFISRATDKVRLAYERRAQMFPRQCVFMGSTNDQEYLRDDTGGRRFWPIECSVSEIDTDKLGREVNQIWAEAYALYRSMRKAQPNGILPLYLADDTARLEAESIQESRRIETADDAKAGDIAAWLDRPMTDENGFEDVDGPALRERVSLIEIWVDMFHKDKSTYNQVVALELGRAMKRVPGWKFTYVEQTARFGKQRVYKRATPNEMWRL